MPARSLAYSDGSMLRRTQADVKKLARFRPPLRRCTGEIERRRLLLAKVVGRAR